jgi:hypothetical protein
MRVAGATADKMAMTANDHRSILSVKPRCPVMVERFMAGLVTTP